MDDPQIHGGALREAGRDPDAAGVRRPEVVEGYEQ
jgi:hypothetical protein